MSRKIGFILVSSLCLCFASTALAVDPNPLENAYWRFEEGTAGQIVAGTSPGDAGSVIDVTVNDNNMRQYSDLNAPEYTTEVPGSIVPATGETNNLALRFVSPYRDIYTDTKHINNPIVNAFTLEASFNVDAAGDGPWRAIVSKESTEADTSTEAPPLALKISGDDGRLMIQIRDKGNNHLDIFSLAPIQPHQWYHTAVVATSTELKLYLNSNDGNGYVLQGAVAVRGGGPLWQGTDPAKGYDSVWNIGKGMWNHVLTDFFDGVIDEVRISNTALAPSDFLWFKVRPPGDVDGDYDVDETDLFIFQHCATGPDIPYGTTLPAGCTATFNDQGFMSADFDKDRDVDQSDFGIWQRCFSGDGQTGDPSC